MSKFNTLIPENIKKLLNHNEVNVRIILTSTSANGVYPKIKIKMDDNIIFDGSVIKEISIPILTMVNKSSFNFQIEHYGKTDAGTVVDDNGNIIENQTVTISGFFVNEVDITKRGLMSKLGCFYPNLSQEKQKYFLDIGISVGPSQSLTMFENGTWSLEFKMPVLYWFNKLVSPQEIHEKWPNQDLMDHLYDKIQLIRFDK